MTRLLALALCLAGVAHAQDRPDVTLDDAGRREAIDGVLARLEAGYIFPKVAEAMVADVRARQATGAYDGITSGRALADSLTRHLRAVSHDAHLHTDVSPWPRPTEEASAAEAVAGQASMEAFMLRYLNNGVDRAERLDGNVGYLSVTGFAPSRQGLAEVVASAMTFLSRTDALIVDLRQNQGGEPEAVQLLASYFFGAEPVLLNAIYSRPDDATTEYWSRADLDGPRYGTERPVFVLTSARSFSAAEEFAYDLQTRGRAVVVGETTGGGAHSGDYEWATDRIRVWVPSERAVNPVTGTNWEGTGVAPDVPAPAADALRVAHVAALRALAAEAAEAGDERRRAEMERLIAELESES